MIDGDLDSPDPQQFAAAYELLQRHLFDDVAHEDWVQAVEHDASIPRWYVRFGTDDRDAATIYFDLHQRSLHCEVYFLPDPPSNHEVLYRAALTWNHNAYGVAFSIGSDGDLYLRGRVLLEHLDAAELDRIIGSIYLLVDRYFPAAVRIAYRRT